MNKVTRFYNKEEHSIISKLRIAKLFKELHEEAFLPEYLMARFRKSWIFPLSKDVITEYGKIKNSILFVQATTTPLVPCFASTPKYSSRTLTRHSILGDITQEAANRSNIESLANSLSESMVECLRKELTQ